MAQIGIFSSLIPYIVLALSYITAVGYYSFSHNGSKDEEETEALFVSASHVDTAGADCYYFSDSENGQVNVIDSKKNYDFNFGIIPFNILHYGKLVQGQRISLFQSTLFSRPPPETVC